MPNDYIAFAKNPTYNSKGNPHFTGIMTKEEALLYCEELQSRLHEQGCLYTMITCTIHPLFSIVTCYSISGDSNSLSEIKGKLDALPSGAMVEIKYNSKADEHCAYYCAPLSDQPTWSQSNAPTATYNVNGINIKPTTKHATVLPLTCFSDAFSAVARACVFRGEPEKRADAKRIRYFSGIREDIANAHLRDGYEQRAAHLYYWRDSTGCLTGPEKHLASMFCCFCSAISPEPLTFGLTACTFAHHLATHLEAEREVKKVLDDRANNPNESPGAVDIKSCDICFMYAKYNKNNRIQVRTDAPNTAHMRMSPA